MHVALLEDALALREDALQEGLGCVVWTYYWITLPVGAIHHTAAQVYKSQHRLYHSKRETAATGLNLTVLSSLTLHFYLQLS